MVGEDARGSLINRLEGARREAQKKADGAIEGLNQIAVKLDMRETAAKLNVVQRGLDSDTFRLIVMGRFNNGKSTLLNSLMGGTTRPVELGGSKGPMVVGDLPTTAILTAVQYAEEPYVKVWTTDGKSQTWSLTKYLDDSILDLDEKESERRFQNIRQFEMGFPARLCQAGVVVYDSPGLDDRPWRTRLTREATARCDAAIVVYRSDVPMGESELAEAAHAVAEGTRVFTVINLIGNREADARLRKFVWNRYVRDHLQGPEWDGQDLTSYDVFFLDARQAVDARYAGDEQGVDRSGLGAFERRLGSFLVGDRLQTHLEKFTKQATTISAAIDQHIGQRQLAAKADQGRLREAYHAAQPKLKEIRARADKLPQIINRYREEATREISASFTLTLARIRQELPDHLQAATLPSSQKMVKVLHHQKMMEEASKEVSDYLTRRLDEWSQTEVTALLKPLLERLTTEIEAEVAAIGHELDQLSVSLTGFQVDASSAGPVVGTTERVVSAAVGMLFGDFSGVVAGGVGGWRGAVGGLAGYLGSFILLTVVGIGGVVFWPLMLAGAAVVGFMAGGAGLDKRVKEKVLKTVDDQLRTLPAEAGPAITAKVRESFAELEQMVRQEITAAIDEEERNIQNVVELNMRDQAERERSLLELVDASAAVARHRLALAEALTIARQV